MLTIIEQFHILFTATKGKTMRKTYVIENADDLKKVFIEQDKMTGHEVQLNLDFIEHLNKVVDTTITDQLKIWGDDISPRNMAIAIHLVGVGLCGQSKDILNDFDVGVSYCG